MPPPPPCSGQRRASISSRLRRRCSQKFFFFFALFRVGPDAYFLFMAGALRWSRSHAKDRTRLIIGERHRSERHSPPTLFHVPNSIQSSLVTAVPRTTLHPNLLSRGVPQSAALLFQRDLLLPPARSSSSQSHFVVVGSRTGPARRGPAGRVYLRCPVRLHQFNLSLAHSIQRRRIVNG